MSLVKRATRSLHLGPKWGPVGILRNSSTENDLGMRLLGSPVKKANNMSHTERHGRGYRGVYRDAEGRRHRTPTVLSRREARLAAEEQERKVRAGAWLDPAFGRTTLGTYVADHWLPNRGGELNTRASYESYWRAIEPRFGSTELRRITTSAVQGWVTEMVAAGITPGTIRSRVVFLQTVLAAKRGASAMRDGFIERNPCWGVSIPTVPSREVQIFEPDEYERLLTAVDPFWRPLIVVAAETGLRWGELMGLRVLDVASGAVLLDRAPSSSKVDAG